MPATHQRAHVLSFRNTILSVHHSTHTILDDAYYFMPYHGLSTPYLLSRDNCLTGSGGPISCATNTYRKAGGGTTLLRTTVENDVPVRTVPRASLAAWCPSTGAKGTRPSKEKVTPPSTHRDGIIRSRGTMKKEERTQSITHQPPVKL